MSYLSNAHIQLVIKAIEELHYEEILDLTSDDDFFYLTSPDEVVYKFRGHIGAWGAIQIECSSIQKISNNQELPIIFDQFFIEFQDLLGMSDQALAQFIEEGFQTIYSESKILKTYEKLDDLIDESYDYTLIDSLCSGHPKLIMNKGRIGWGVNDLKNYAPESHNSFQLKWLVVKKDLLILGFNQEFDYRNYLTEQLHLGVSALNDDEIVIPVHPWQWDHYIKIQYSYALESGDIRELDEEGPFVIAQASIRTLSTNSISDFDIKLSLSILNTSCVRGIPHRFIESGQLISSFMENIAREDKALDKLDILGEVGAFAMTHRSFHQIHNASYRYKELFGGVFRENVKLKLTPQQKAIPIAGLLIENNEVSLIEKILNYSKLEVKEWIQMYADNVIIPLYHLQVYHGIGLVAHGQNTILKLENHKPVGVIIKDFHGDLRIANDSRHQSHKVASYLDSLPSEYLIHDLYTAHFVTTLRYFSRLLEKKNILSERDFYQIISKSVQEYLDAHTVQAKVNLTKEEFEKVLVNKVRFLMGYDETASRLKPMLGHAIKNPLRKGAHYESSL